MADNVTVSNAPTSVNNDIPVRTLDKSGEQVQVVAIDFGGSGAEDLNVPEFATEPTLEIIADATASSTDILGVAVAGSRNNQVEISFVTTFDSDIITNATTGTGSATISNGHALYATGAGTTATATGTSVGTIVYRPAHEQYAYFTAAFTTPTSANSNQRIGIYDSNNGFFIGYQGTTFGVTKRTAGVDTFTARTSWNGDLLTGLATSKFTRNGTPEAIDLSYSNLFRIRFAWLGSANILFDVFNADGKWVNFHNIRQPNSALNPSINNPNLTMKVEALKSSADATNLIIYTACWAGGTTSDRQKITDTLTDDSLASLTRSVITGQTTGGGGGYVNVKVNPSGALTTETSVTSLPTSTGAAPSFATVGITSASIGLASATYQKIAFCNTSVATISLSFNGAAVANRGIVLAAGEKVFIDGPIVVTTINAIANAGSSNLAIQAFT